MNCWQVLGIKPTNNLKVIKKAYAAKSREVHPEEHPEEFRLLHDSYETALTLAKTYKFDADEAGNRQAEEVSEPAKMSKATEPTEDNDFFAAADSAEIHEPERKDNIFRIVDKTKVPDTPDDSEKSDTENFKDTNIDFDAVLENADEEHAKKVIAATKAVMTSLEKAVSYPKEKERKKAVNNVILSNYFKECCDIPFFAHALTEFVKSHQDLTDAFYGPVFMALHFDVLETREQKGMYEELYSVFSQRGKVGFNPQKNKFVKPGSGSVGSIIAVIVFVVVRAVARMDNDLPTWAYVLIGAAFIGFTIFVFVKNKMQKANQNPEQNPKKNKSFWNPKARVRELRYFSKLAVAVDIMALDFVFIWMMGENYDSDLSILVIAATAIVSILILVYFLVVNTIIFIKSKATHTKPWKPEFVSDRKRANALFAIFVILDIMLFVAAIAFI